MQNQDYHIPQNFPVMPLGMNTSGDPNTPIVSELLSNLGTELGIVVVIKINASVQMVLINHLFFR